MFRDFFALVGFLLFVRFVQIVKFVLDGFNLLVQLACQLTSFVRVTSYYFTFAKTLFEYFFDFFLDRLWSDFRVYTSQKDSMLCNQLLNENFGRSKFSLTHLVTEAEKKYVGNCRKDENESHNMADCFWVIQSRCKSESIGQRVVPMKAYSCILVKPPIGWQQKPQGEWDHY